TGATPPGVTMQPPPLGATASGVATQPPALAPTPGLAAPPAYQATPPRTPGSKPDATHVRPGETPQPARLIGCVEGNCQNGTGTFVHDDGARYIGEWRNGKMHGAGEFRFSSGGGYRGIWQNGHVTRIE
ncbi:MAG: hypothetical protein HQL86_07170, partial [Magnetococcales bacterium]|nr:hypothetical protein [Magnetococcales bacterium]